MDIHVSVPSTTILCEGNHPEGTHGTKAVLVIEGPEDISLALCAAHTLVLLNGLTEALLVSQIGRMTP